MAEQTEQTDPWTTFLDWLAQIVIPDWSSLVAFMPLAIFALVLLWIALLALGWWRAGAVNRSRVPRRLEAAPPPGVHLPGPSRWPFVVPIGMMLLLFAIAVRPANEDSDVTGPVNVPLLVAGLVVSAVAIVGWLRDAMRDWRRAAELEDGHGAALAPAVAGAGAAGLQAGTRVEAGAALQPGAVESHPATAGPHAESAPFTAAPPLEPPPGVHLPGPSPWPFFAPIAMTVIFFGLVFNPLILLAGVVMGIISAAGWYLDAGREYGQVEEGHAPEPRTRDPERAFPKRLLGVFAGIAALSLVLLAVPAIIGFANPSAAPSGGAAAGGGAGGEQGGNGGGAGGPIAIAAENVQFDTEELTVPADEPFTIAFDNREAVPHNVAIYEDESLDTPIFVGEVITGPQTIEYSVPAVPAGSYYFLCTVHPNMKGTVTAQ